MTSHAIPRQIALYVETAFVTGGPADWSNNGTYVYAIDPDVSSVVQASTANENNQLRARAFHPNIRTLRNGNLSFSMYMHGKPTNAAEAAAATTYHLAELLQAALGGKDLGWSAGVVTSGTELATEIELDTDPGFEQGDWVYYKSAAGVGEFYRVESVAGAAPVILTVDRDVHVAVIDRSVNDTLHAVIDCYIHQQSTTQPAHAQHKTMQFLVQGQDDEDVVIAKGCKPQVTIEPITAGEPTRLSFDVLVTTFEGADEALKEDFGAAVPVGEAGVVAGIGTTCTFKLADFGSPLATVTQIGAITVEPGVAYERIQSATGHEGVIGHIDSLEDTTLEVMVEFDADYNLEYRAGTLKHALIQVGNSTNAWGVYLPKLEYATEPVRGEEGNVTTSNLSLRAMENSASLGSLTGDSAWKWRSPMHVLLVA
jgi:hypothetical protein